MTAETFLGLNMVGWTAIGSIATSMAVAIALLKPYYDNWKKIRNITKLIEKENEENQKNQEAWTERSV